MMQSPQPFLPKKGNYRGLAFYKKAEILYDLTFYFTKRFLGKGDRTVDQMVQAARSGKQNIAEGSAAAATSSETELKLTNVARASMKELLVDYEDYLRVRGLEQWTKEDPRAKQTLAFCKNHDKTEDYMHDIDQRSDEVIANVAIALLHQFDIMIARYIDYLEKTFVEQGGIRERMTAARLDYRGGQKAEIERLQHENDALRNYCQQLKARIEELEAARPAGATKATKATRPGEGIEATESLEDQRGPRGPLALLLLLALLLGACCHDDDEKPVQEKGTPITFSGSEAETQQGGNKAPRASMASTASEASTPSRASTPSTRAATPLSDLGIRQFKVWGFKNTGNDANYPTYQMVFPTSGYAVEWEANSAATSTTNTSNWEYILTSHPDQTVKYWDLSAAAYRFAARTTSIEASEEIKENTLTHDTELTLTIPGLYSDHVADAPYVSKLWFSTGEYEHYPDKQFLKPVVLEFVKPFSHVRFMFVSADPSVKIEDMELSDMLFKPTDDSGVGISGTVVVTYPITGTTLRETFDSTPSKTITGFTQDYTENIKFTQAEIDAAGVGDPAYGKTTDDVRIAGSYLWYTVLPVSSQGSFTLSLSVYGEPRTAVVPAGYMTWKAGYQYTYIFKVSGDGGVEFGDLLTAFTGWSEGFTGVEAVYNW